MKWSKRTQELENQEEKKQDIPKKNGLLGNAVNYCEYQMSALEAMIGFLLGFVGSNVVCFVFFRNVLLGMVIGTLLGVITIQKYKAYLIQKRKKILLMQFRDLLESLAASYSSGKNTVDAFRDAYDDMKQLYDADSDIVKEISILLTGIQSNLTIEILLLDFAERSELDDVRSFANVFEISLRQGANMKNIIASTRDIISDKIEIEMEIQSILAGNKNELNIMIIMPLVIIMSLGGLGGGTITENSVMNVIIKIFVLGLFGVAYKMGQKITDIKI